MADQEREELHEAVRDTESDMLNKAFAPAEKEPVEPEAAPEPEAPQERMRDPATGRFTKSMGETEAEKPADVPAHEQTEKPDDIVPSWRLREINEEKRRIEAERDQLRAEHARMQAYYAQMQRQAPQQKEPEIDPVLDPKGFAENLTARLRSEFAQQQAADRLNFNLEMTHMRYGEKFEKAFEAIIAEGQRGNNQLVRHITSQPNAGEALMRWYNTNQLVATVGTDPEAYAKKVREQLLNDPEFLEQAAQRMRDQAMGGNGQRPNTVVKMPPSLSKATGTNETAPTHTDGSEEALFAYAMSSPRRR